MTGAWLSEKLPWQGQTVPSMSHCPCLPCCPGSWLSFYVLIYRFDNSCRECRPTLTAVLVTESWIRYIPKHLLTPPLRRHESEMLSTATSRKKELSFFLSLSSVIRDLGKHQSGALLVNDLGTSILHNFWSLNGFCSSCPHNQSINPNKNVSNPIFCII